MRYFKLEFCCVVGLLISANFFGGPSAALAAEALPDSVVSPPVHQDVVAVGVDIGQWNAPCMDGAGCQERPQHSAETQRRGETIVTLPGLLAVMQQVVQQPGSGVVLHYPEDEQGEAWADELRDWLVALGLASNRIQLTPGSNAGVINISLGAAIQSAEEKRNTPPPVVTEPFQVKEATDAVNGVEIP